MTLKNSFFLFALIMIDVTAWIIQTKLPFNWDVNWSFQEAKRLLAGGNYAKDFFEPAPPMFLYLFSASIAFSNQFGLSLALGFRLFIFMLASVSFFICYRLLGSVSKFFLLTIVTTFLALPLPFNFGQREHLFFIFILPYLLLLANRLAHPEKRLSREYPSVYLSFFIGLMAGIGFALKPLFPLTFVFVETYYAFSKKRLSACLRPETITIFLFLVLYILIIYLFHRHYLTVIVPFMLRYHYQSYHFSWNLILFNPVLFFCGLILLFYLMHWKSILSPLLRILFVACLSLILLYLVQRSPWDYHLFPAYSLAILFSVLLFNFLYSTKQKILTHFIHYFSFGILGLVVLVFPIYYSYLSISTAFFYQKLGNRLSAYTEEISNQPVYFLATTMPPALSIMDAFHMKPVSEFPHFAWLAGLLKSPIQNEKQRQQVTQDKAFIINTVAHELAIFKPLYVFVDSQKNKPYLDQIKFDYLNEFSKYPAFQTAWQAYHYYATIEKKDSYQFTIYKRI